SQLVMGLPPWRTASAPSWCTPGWTCVDGGPYPIWLEHVQGDETSIVGTLPDANNHRFWEGALPGDTYIQVLTHGGSSNKFPVNFPPIATVKSPTPYPLGSPSVDHDIQPRNAPPKKQSGSSSAPQPSPNPTSNTTEQLQLQNQLRTLQTQLVTASAADKPR